MNKCEELKFAHAWKDTTSNIVLTSNPPIYPDKQETCINCGLTRVYRKQVRNWIEYSDGHVHEDYNGALTVGIGDGIGLLAGAGGNGTTTLKNVPYTLTK